MGMPTNGFLPFAAAAGSNVITDAQYASNGARQLGFTTGRAPSAVFNKAQLQASMASSALMQFAADWSGQDALDSLPVVALEANFRMALAAALSGAYVATDASGTANLVTITLTPAPVTLGTLQIPIYVRVANTNTGPVQVQANSFPSRVLLRNDGLAVKAGDVIAGVFYAMVNDGVAFRLTEPAASQLGTFPAPASVATFTLAAPQTIPNNATSQIAVGGSNPSWGTLSGSTLTITKGGIYTVTLDAFGTVTPSALTSHATVFAIYVNGANAAQQSCINWTNQAQNVGLSPTYTTYMPAGTAINFWAYMGNSGTSDTCVVTSASANVTKVS